MNQIKQKICIFWFRRDLRLHDNHGLYQALKGEFPVLPVFIFDSEILGSLTNHYDRRVHYIHYHAEQIKKKLNETGSDLLVLHGKPEQIFLKLITEYDIGKIICNHDYEPYARKRDNAVQQICTTHQILFETYKDQVIFEKNEITKPDGTPYQVFTPYAKRWLFEAEKQGIIEYETKLLVKSFFPVKNHFIMPSLQQLGFEKTNVSVETTYPPVNLLEKYETTRDFPAITGTSRVSMGLRFGTISIRTLAAPALKTSVKYLTELIWREFYMMLLWHYPETVTEPFQKKYKSISWISASSDFEKWCRGETGFALVDAGMRELNTTGFMHNRVRMVTASFLCKQLLCDWRFGERYFAAHLNDFDLASNIGGWQWCAGIGADAAPYFRIFNPNSQLKKFDPDYRYVSKFIPEYGEPGAYTEKMVDLKMARERCLLAFRSVQ
jgi:deoxyribodipyrimidine photo-lyase